MLEFIKRIFRKIKCYIRLPIRKVRLTRPHPISNQFGFDRGIPIDRYYIERWIQQNQEYIKGNLLEIAEDTYCRKFSIKENDCDKNIYNILTYDKTQNIENIIHGDLTDFENLPENKIDCFICTQTLNFIYDVKSAIKGIYKLLANEGTFIGTVAGLSQISRYDMERWGDYWRFTDLSIKKLFEEEFGIGNVEVISYGNVAAATAFIQGIAVEDLPNKKMLDIQDNDYQVTIGIKAVKRK